MRAIFVPISLFFCFFALPAFAQLDLGFSGQSQAILLLEPDFPQPNELVTVSIENFGAQLFNADITWRLNDVVIADATNRRSIEITAGELGDSDLLTATIVRQSGGSETISTVISPKYIDIILEPQTRVPDFYPGRALPSVGSQINATVLINDGSVVTGDFLYTWRLNNKILESGPLRGTNQIVFDTPRGSRVTLSVEVVSLTGEVVARRSIYFESVRPELHFYEINALYGQSHNVLSNDLLLTNQAVTVVAEPYYLDIRYFNDPDIIEWKINQTLQPSNVINPYQITIQKISDGGSANVSFHVRSTTELLQGVEDNFNVIF